MAQVDKVSQHRPLQTPTLIDSRLDSANFRLSRTGEELSSNAIGGRLCHSCASSARIIKLRRLTPSTSTCCSSNNFTIGSMGVTWIQTMQKKCSRYALVFYVTYGRRDTDTVLVVSKCDLSRRIQTQTDDEG